MNDLKRLIREAHRRSLWQVVTIYLAMSWGALQVVQTIVDSAALPEWLPGLALVLLVIGFPVVVATAFVQEGAPGMGGGWSSTSSPEPGEYDAPPANVAAGTGSLDRKRTKPKAGRALFTWKNAIMGGVGAFALWGVIAAFLISTGRPVGPTPLSAADRAAVAVLPLESLAVEGSGDDAFARGFHDEIITRLSKISALRVTSRTSVMQYAGQTGNMRDIARQLGVDMLLEGSLQRAGNQIALNIQLIDGQTDEHLWAQSYNREYSLENVFAMQRQLAEEIAAELSMTLSPEEAAELADMPTANPEAWDTYQQANEFYWAGPRAEDFETAIRLYERAVEQDPGFALAHARLGFALGQAWQTTPPQERTEAFERQARDAVARAFELDPELPEAFLAEGQLYYALDQNWGLALASASKATATGLKGDYYHLMGAAQRRVGDFDGGVQSWREMVAVDPLSGHYYEDLGSILGMVGQFEEAETALRRAIELAPEGLGAYNFLLDVLLAMDGTTDRAWELLPAAEAASGGPWSGWRAELHYLDRDYEAALLEPVTDLLRSFSLKMAGRGDEARGHADQFENQWANAPEGDVPGFGPGYWFRGASIAAMRGDREAVVERVDEGFRVRSANMDHIQIQSERFDAARALTHVGEYDRALDLLEQLGEGNREMSGRYIALYPDFDPLRDDPRFQAIAGG